MKKYLTSLLLAMVLFVICFALLPGLAKAGIFLQIPDIPGESAYMKGGWIDVLGFSTNSVYDPATRQSCTNDISITKNVDAATPLLIKEVYAGRLLQAVTFEFTRAGDNSLYYRIVLNNAMVTSVGNDGSGGDDRATESLRISFGTLTWSYYKLNPDGTVKDTIAGSADNLAGCGKQCKGDFDGDGDVDANDLSVFVADIDRTDCDTGPPCEGDFDRDNDVDASDLAIFARYFGRKNCP